MEAETVHGGDPPASRRPAARRPRRARPRVSAELLTAAAGRLTARDRRLCQLLWEHRVLTTPQIAEIAFGCVRTAEKRLLALYRLRVLDRFRPPAAAGSAPFHYVIGAVGARVVAAEQGVDLRALGYHHDRTLAVAYSQRLAHVVGVNGFFAALCGHARRCGRDSALLRWWSEARCAAAWGHIVRPDGYGRWAEQGHRVDFFLEYDRGTERPVTRLTDRLAAYADLAQATAITTPVLIWLPTPTRERAVHDQLTPSAAVPVATAHPIPNRSPAQAVWLPAGAGRRQPLIAFGEPTAAHPQMWTR